MGYLFMFLLGIVLVALVIGVMIHNGTIYLDKEDIIIVKKETCSDGSEQTVDVNLDTGEVIDNITPYKKQLRVSKIVQDAKLKMAQEIYEEQTKTE